MGPPVTSAPPLPTATGLQVRYLLPFLFDRRSARRAAESLCAATSGPARGLWAREPRRRLYRYRLGMTAHLDRVLFPDKEAGDAGGCYLRASPSVMQRWFTGVEVDLPGGRMPIALEPETGLELFLISHGAGVLSLTLCLEGPIELPSAVDLVNRLARLARPGTDAPWLLRDPGDAAPAGPSADPHQALPLVERLTAKGGRFALAELLTTAIEPLAAFGITPIQEALCAYSVVRFGPETDLGSREGRRVVGPFLDTLAQVEEPARAPPPGVVGVPHLLVDARHWAAASLQGSAHLLVEAPAGATTEDRSALARDRYFVPYLAALLQRCAIKKAAEEATSIVNAPSVTREQVTALRGHVLEFALSGAVPEVSVRSSLQRYYRTCQRAMDLRRNLAGVRRAVADFEEQLAARHQREIAESQHQIAARTAEALESSHKIHVALEWIETFIVVAYAAELVKFFLIDLHEMQSGSTRWLAVALVILPGLVALAILRPWRHRHRRRPGDGDRPS